MKKTKLILSVAVVISGILTVLFSFSITDLIYFICLLQPPSYATWLEVLLPSITPRIVTLGGALIVVGVIYILFGKE